MADEVRYPDGRFFDDHEILADLSRPLQLELREHRAERVLAALGISLGSRVSHLLSDALE